jgi:hypothetical protein
MLASALWAGAAEVSDMAFLSVIRRWHFREHLSIRGIARRTGLSWNTIRKYVRSEAVEPVFRTPDRPSTLDWPAAGSMDTEFSLPRPTPRNP